MRKEATLQQWGALYEAATKIKELQPWETFWDMDIIGIQYGNEPENSVFISVLGHGGSCYGIVVYEGYEGLNDFVMLSLQEKMNLSAEYVMLQQTNLTCYWGNREELTDKQRKIIKDLGYSYRGKNQWLYFLSFAPGYFPYNFDEEEVVRMTEYMQDLELALRCYNETKPTVNFAEGNMFLLKFSEDKKSWSFGERPLPFTSFQFGSLEITNEELLADLATIPKGKHVLEAEIAATGARVSDKEFDRPASPALAVLIEANSGMALKCEMTHPEDDPVIMLAEQVLQFIFQYGAPKEIRVSNVIVEAGLEQICQVCGIKLRRVKRMHATEEFILQMKQFGI